MAFENNVSCTGFAFDFVLLDFVQCAENNAFLFQRGDFVSSGLCRFVLFYRTDCCTIFVVRFLIEKKYKYKNIILSNNQSAHGVYVLLNTVMLYITNIILY